MTASRASLRAVAHPLRLQMLSLLTGGALSAAEVARELNTTQANASYHLRQLLACGLLEVAEEVRVRGGRAKRYRVHPANGFEILGSDADADAVFTVALGAELRRRRGLREAGGVGPTADAELWVDPEIWRDVCSRVLSAVHDLHAAARPARTAGTLRTSTTLSMFVMRSQTQEGRQ